MLTLLLANPLLFLIIFPGLIAAITIHEFAHAWVADKLGDPAPRYQGRVTLDPRAHLDPWGTLFILIARFGWGKPVEFDPYNLKEPIRDTALIALAGPLVNLLFATLLAFIIKTLQLPDLVVFSLVQLVFINVALAIFNLIPVHPLDGSKILLSLLPPTTAVEYEQFMHRYGFFVLLVLLIPWGSSGSPVQTLIAPIVDTIIKVLL